MSILRSAREMLCDMAFILPLFPSPSFVYLKNKFFPTGTVWTVPNTTAPPSQLGVLGATL